MKNITFINLLLLLSTIVQAQWTQLPGPKGGTSITFASNANTLFTGSDIGVFRSADNGIHWTQTRMDNMEIGSIAVNGEKIYAGTLSGLYGSEDNGVNWSLKGLENEYVVTVLWNSDRLLAGTWGQGVFYSQDGGNTWTQSLMNSVSVVSMIADGSVLYAGTSIEGVFRSADNGTTWTPAGLAGYSVWGLCVYKEKILAATTGGLFASTDNGQTWSANLYYDFIRAICKQGDDLYMSVANKGIYVSYNGGAEWTHSTPFGQDAYGLYALDNRVFCGSSIYGVWYTDDRGDNWQQSEYYGERVNALVDMDGVIVANKFSESTLTGSLFTSANLGYSWTSVTEYDILGTSLAISGPHVLSGRGSGIWYSGDQGGSWAESNLDNYHVRALCSHGDQAYAGAGGDGVYYSSDHGVTWIKQTLTGQDVYAITARGDSVIAGTQSNGVFLSADRGLTWTQSLQNPGWVYGFEWRGDTLWAATRGGGVYRSVDKGVNWIQTNLNTGWVHSVKQCGNYLVAGIDRGGVKVSVDGGMNWYEKNDGLNPHTSVISFLIIGNELYAGTSLSVWKRPLEELVNGIGRQESHRLEFYPNPVKDKIRIVTPMTSGYQLNLYSLTGNLVFASNGEPGQQEISFTGIAQGVYMLEIISDDRIQRGKVVVLD